MNENQTEHQPEQHEELTRMVEPEVIKMGAVQRVISIFAAPGELMHNIKAYPVILVPFLLSVVLGLIAIAPNLQVTEMTTQEMSHISIERYGVDLFAELTMADEYGETAMDAMGAFTIITLVVSAILGPLLMSFFATLGIFILSKIFRGRAKFMQLFSVYMHAYVIVALGTIVSASIMAATGSISEMTSLAPFIMPEGNIATPAYIVLMSIAIFPVWATVVIFFGVKIVNEFSALKAAIITVIYYATFVAINVVILMITWWSMDMLMAMGV